MYESRGILQHQRFTESEALEQSSSKSSWLDAAATTTKVEIKFNY
jgi:hypothetical protein